jgi:hypothetical protein
MIEAVFLTPGQIGRKGAEQRILQARKQQPPSLTLHRTHSSSHLGHVLRRVSHCSKTMDLRHATPNLGHVLSAFLLIVTIG